MKHVTRTLGHALTRALPIALALSVVCFPALMLTVEAAPKEDSRVSQALEDEPAILAPVHKRKRALRIPFIMKQVGGLAIAATVSAVAVLTVQHTQDQTTTTPTEIAAANPPAQVRYVSDTSGLDTAVQSKLDGYLVNHNEYSVSANMQGVLPYMRIVSETPGKKVIVRRVNDQQ